MKPVLRGHPGWVDWGEHKSWASHLRAGAQQSEASWEVWGTFSVFSFLCPLGPMIFLREGGNSPCHAEVGGSHLLYGPRQEQGEKIFSMAGLKLQAFWVIMRPLIRADNTNIQQIDLGFIAHIWALYKIQSSHLQSLISNSKCVASSVHLFAVFWI